PPALRRRRDAAGPAAGTAALLGFGLGVRAGRPHSEVRLEARRDVLRAPLLGELASVRGDALAQPGVLENLDQLVAEVDRAARAHRGGEPGRERLRRRQRKSALGGDRSEERRVGKEGRARW